MAKKKKKAAKKAGKKKAAPKRKRPEDEIQIAARIFSSLSKPDDRHQLGA